MTTTETPTPKTTPSLTPEQLTEALALIKGADSVELKLTVPDIDRPSAVAALDVNPPEAQIRPVVLFDTTDLALNAHVVVRARPVQRQGNVGAHTRRAGVGTHPGRCVCGSCRAVRDYRGAWPLKRAETLGVVVAFSRRRLERYPDSVVKLRPVVLSELSADLSTKCAPPEAFQVPRRRPSSSDATSISAASSRSRPAPPSSSSPASCSSAMRNRRRQGPASIAREV